MAYFSIAAFVFFWTSLFSILFYLYYAYYRYVSMDRQDAWKALNLKMIKLDIVGYQEAWEDGETGGFSAILNSVLLR